MEEAVEKLNVLMNKIDCGNASDLIRVGALILASVCYQQLNQLKKSKELVDEAGKILSGKEYMPRYTKAYTAYIIRRVSLLEHNKEYLEVIEVCSMMIDYMIEMASYERSHYFFFYLALAHMHEGNTEATRKWLTKALYAANLKHKPDDMYIMSRKSGFYDLLDGNIVSKDVIDHFYEMYPFIKTGKSPYEN